MRKTSYGGSGDYDSELVDGRYLTTVPIISIDDGEDEGNLRPAHRPSPRGLKDLKKPREDNVVDRLTRTSSVRETNGGSGRRAVSQSAANVFDRLSTKDKNGGLRGSRRSLLAQDEAATERRSSSSGALTRIKDLTKNLRKSSREEGRSSSAGGGSGGGSVVAPRNSMSMFAHQERKPMSNLNKLNSPSRTSISSSTKSLNKPAEDAKSRRSTTSNLSKSIFVF